MNDRLVFERDGQDWPNRGASRFVEAAGLSWHVQVMGQG
ncbi:MAG: alpha/beta hydrolase, partial [Methyloceanibacter sp.]